MCVFTGLTQTFDTVVDIGCFHSLDEEDRPAYAANLYWMCRPGAVVYLRAISANNSTKGNHPSGKPTPALGAEHIRTAFSSGDWIVEDLSERQIELFLSDDRKPKVYCWFATIHRP
jgi:cyclopropane fatty-acyl-phospholipid synthase-like methyltransferase